MSNNVKTSKPKFNKQVPVLYC